MFCGKCGAEVREGTQFCSKCGQPMHVTPQPAAVSAAGAVAVSRKNRKVGIIAMAAVGVLVVAVIVGAVFFFTPKDNAETVAKNYILSIQNGKFGDLSKYCIIDMDETMKFLADSMEKSFESALDNAGDEEKKAVNDCISDMKKGEFFKTISDGFEDYALDFYGPDWEATAEVISTRTLSKESMEREYEKITENMDGNSALEFAGTEAEKVIKKVYRGYNRKPSEIKLVTVEFSRPDAEPVEAEVVVIKFDGQWFACDSPDISYGEGLSGLMSKMGMLINYAYGDGLE